METHMGIVILAILVFSVSIPVAFADESLVEPDKSIRDGNKKMLICFSDHIDQSSFDKNDFTIEDSSKQSLQIDDVITGEPFHTECLYVKFDHNIRPLGITLVYDDKNKSLLDIDGKEIQGFKVIKKSHQRSTSVWFEIIYPYPQVTVDPPVIITAPNGVWLSDNDTLVISFNGTIIHHSDYYGFDISDSNDPNVRIKNIHDLYNAQYNNKIEIEFEDSILRSEFSLVYSEPGNLEDENGKPILGFKIIKEPTRGDFTIIFPYTAPPVIPIEPITAPIESWNLEPGGMVINFNGTINQSISNDGFGIFDSDIPDLDIVLGTTGKTHIFLTFLAGGIIADPTNTYFTLIYDATNGNLEDEKGNKILGFKIIKEPEKNDFNNKFTIIYPYTVPPPPVLPITAPVYVYRGLLNEIVISFNGTLDNSVPTFNGDSGIFTTNNPDVNITQVEIDHNEIIVQFEAPIIRSEFNLIYTENGMIRDHYFTEILGFKVIKEWKEVDGNTFENFFTIIFPYPAISVDPIDETPKKKGGSSNPPPPPTFGKDKKYKQIVTDGFCFNGNCVNVDNYHTEFPLINATVGESSNITLKAYNPNGGLPGFKWFQIILGLEEAGLPLSYGEVLATLHIHQMEIDKIELVDKQNLIGNYTAITNIVQCSEEYTTECLELSFDFTPRDQLINNIVGINVVNNHRSSSTNYLNDGVEFHGDSLNEPLLSQVSASKGGAFYPQNRGLTELTLVSYHDDLWQDSFGYLWTSDNYESFKIISNVPAPQKEPDLMWSAMTRINSNFADMIEFEKERALLVFDSSKLK